MPGTAIAWLLVFALLPGVCLSAQTVTLADRLAQARTVRTQGDPRRALQAYESLLDELRSGVDRVLLVKVLTETAQSAIACGEYASAIEHAGEATRAAHEIHDGQTEGLAYNLSGQARLNAADYGAALSDFERAFTLADQQHDVDAASVRLGNMGNVHFYRGRYLDALQLYERALRKADESAETAANGRHLALVNLAILYERLGQYEKALEYYRQASAPASALRPEEYAQLLSNMGTLYRRRGDPVKALETYAAARRLFERAKHSDGEIHVLHNTGIVLALDSHEPERALAVFTEALRLADKTTSRRQSMVGHLYRAEALLRLGRVEPAHLEYELALEQAKQMGAAEEQWAAHYGLGQVYRRQGQAGLAVTQFRTAAGIVESLRGGPGASTLKAEFLGNKRSVYDAYIPLLLDTASPDPQQLFDLFEKARMRNLQDPLQRRLVRSTIPLIQQRLDDASLLVEYWLGEDRMAALWITRDGTGIAQAKVTPDDLTTIRRLGQHFGDGGKGSWRVEAASVARLVLAGVPLDPKRRTLLIIPDGVLCSIPFDVLPVTGGMLIEHFAVSMLPAGGMLGADSRPSYTAPWKRQVLGFGDPIATGPDELSPPGGWVRLSESAQEVRQVADALPGRAELHLGADNLKRYLAEGAAGARVIHFSTHAAIDVDPSRARIVFTPEAGANGSKYLLAPEAQQLPLTGVDLVTIAAGGIEDGKLVPAEGTQSFSRAFLAAGANSTVTAMWQVAASPTAEFMRSFYREIGRGASKGEALRSAKLWAWRSGGANSDPRFWAAFVLTGDGRTAVPLQGWSSLLGVAGVLLLFVSAGGWMLRRRFRDRAFTVSKQG